jgi:multisubunit Na+/H+ antiporter MnhC subunit
MTPLVAWSILSAGVALALIMIGYRNWGGWLVFAFDSVGWLVYSAVRHESVVVLIFNLLMTAITVYFAYRWGKIAISEEERQESEEEQQVVP